MQVIRKMKILYLILGASLLAVISTALAQSQIDAAVGSIQEQMNSEGAQLQEKAVEHILEGNLTQEHIVQDLNATAENLTAQAYAQVNQELDENLNLTPEQLKLKAEEELKRRVNEQIQQQPGFEVILAMLGTLAAVVLIRRRNI